MGLLPRPRSAVSWAWRNVHKLWGSTTLNCPVNETYFVSRDCQETTLLTVAHRNNFPHHHTHDSGSYLRGSWRHLCTYGGGVQGISRRWWWLRRAILTLYSVVMTGNSIEKASLLRQARQIDLRSSFQCLIDCVTQGRNWSVNGWCGRALWPSRFIWYQ